MTNRIDTNIGSVQDVSGAEIGIMLSDRSLSGLIYVEGVSYKVGQIGSFVKIPLGFNTLYGLVKEVGVSAVPEKVEENQPFGDRWMRIIMVGEVGAEGKFQRGVTQYPSIRDEVHIVSQQDLKKIYGDEKSDNYLRIGSVVGAEDIPSLADIDKLLTRHGLVVGSTGSGKSNTVTSLLKAITRNDFKSSKVLLIDPHSEYQSALENEAKVFKIDSDIENQLKLPFWALSFDELSNVLFGRSLGESQQAQTLIREINERKSENVADLKCGRVNKNVLTVNSPIPFDLKDLWYELYVQVNATVNEKNNLSTAAYKEDDKGDQIKGNKKSLKKPEFEPPATGGKPPFIYNNNKTLNSYLERIRSKLIDTRYSFLFETADFDGINKDLDDLVDNWLSHEKPITILDLGGIPFDVMDMVIGLITRICFETVFWGRNEIGIGRQRPLLMVYEEAHSYLPRGGNNQMISGYSSRAVRRVCKEGRKYGIGALVVSQRPSELDESIVSQIGSFICLRLSNSEDQGIVKSIIPDNTSGLSNLLPSLRTGEGIVLGEAFKIPSRIKIPLVEPRPDSNDPIPSKAWEKEFVSIDYTKTITNWRHQVIIKNEEK
jgi:DNA helicase HerA-like ATPase